MKESNLKSLESNQEIQQHLQPIIIVGNGPVGVRAAGLILEKDSDARVVIFGEESYQPYNRVQLSLFLAGSISRAQLANPIIEDRHRRLEQVIGQAITGIDPDKRFILTPSGERHYYSKLILALGSSPVTPDINNINRKGVYQFRTFRDAKTLLKKKQDSKNIFVVGSGPLGLETAVAMKQPNNKVTLQVREKTIESSSRSERSVNSI